MTASVVMISARSNGWVQELRRAVHRSASYRTTRQVWLEGDHLCLAWLQADQRQAEVSGQSVRSQAIAVITEVAWNGRPDLRALAIQAGQVKVVSQEVMEAISTLPSAAALAFAVPWRPEAWPTAVPEGSIAVLDRLQDPGNVGSILRSAAALGIAHVVALSGTVALWSPKVLRAGMGAHFALSLHEDIALDSVVAYRSWRERLVVTSSHGAQPLPQAALPPQPIWVLGHEGGGVDPRLVEAAPLRVQIPQPGGQESLNVAAAAVVCFYEAASRSLRGRAQ